MKARIYLLLFLLISSQGFALKTVYFNGKPYKVYPHYVDLYSGQIGKADIDNSNYKIENLHIPPTIGQYEDGEYILYSTVYDLKFKRKEGKYRIYDTIYSVYATFTIKNNLKNGYLNLFKRTEQSKPYFTLPYVDDMIEGVIYYKEKNYSRRYYKKNPNSNRARVGAVYDFFKVNYKEGLANGTQYMYYLLENNDTVLYKTTQMLKGAKSGWTISRTLDKKNKKVIQIGIDSSHYVEGLEHGLSVYRGKESITISKYEHGDEKEYRIYENGKLMVVRVEHIDSISNYIKNYKEVKMLPRAGGFDEDEGFVYANYRNPSYAYITFAKGNYVRDNYYKFYSYLKDTVINGNFFIYEKSFSYRSSASKEKIKYKVLYYSLDTCSVYNDSKERKLVSQFCKNIKFEQYFSEDKLIKTIYLPQYFSDYKDSANPVLIDHIKDKEVDIKKFYHPVFNFSFWDIQYHSGKMAGCKEYYKFKGGPASGRIIHCFQMPLNGDTLYCMDTLMNKGKFLYTKDYWFESEISDYLEMDTTRSVHKKSRSSRLFTAQFYNFFLPSPVRHTSILVGNKPFTGWFNINLNYEKKAKEVKGGVYLVKSLLAQITKEEFIEIDLDIDKNYLKVNTHDAFVIPASRFFVYLDHGHFTGYSGIRNKNDNFTYQLIYEENKLSSDVSLDAYTNYSRSSYRRYSEFEEEIDFYRGYVYTSYEHYSSVGLHKKQSPSMMYAKGEKEGQWYMPIDDYIYTFTYHKGKRNGKNYTYYTTSSDMDQSYTYLNSEYNMTNDTVNGEIWNLNMYGFPDYYGKFNMGVPDGYFYWYKGDSTNGNYKQRMHFSKGILDGQLIENRDSAGLKMTIDFDIKDSMYKDVFNIRSYNTYRSTLEDTKIVNSRYADYKLKPSTVYFPDDFISYIFSTNSFKRGYYRYYYKNGTLFSEGEKKDEEPNGLWKFYRENGKSLYKTIEFHDTIIKLSSTDSFFAYAFVKAYYEDGKLMYTGWATDRSSKYSCESETELPTEEDYYLEFYDTLGKPMSIQDSCFVIEYQVNGYKLKEGNMVNGKKTGVWIYYSRYGLPTEIGRYVNGKKEGRWLVGDLSGLNLSENICFMSSEEFMAWVMMFGGNLKLSEVYYENGEYIRGSSVDTVKQ